MTSDPARPSDSLRPSDHDLLYSQQEVLSALTRTMLQHPAFAYYPESTRTAMLEAILANIDEHAPSRIQSSEYLRRLRSELRRLQDPASLGRQAVESAVRLGGKALLDRARQQAVRVVQEARGGPARIPEVLYTRAALETGLRETLRRHPQFGHYPEATRLDLQEALLGAMEQASPHRLTYGAFLREMLDRASLQDAAEPLGLLGSAAKGAGRNLLGSLRRRVHEYTAGPAEAPAAPEDRPAVGAPVLRKPDHE